MSKRADADARPKGAYPVIQDARFAGIHNDPVRVPHAVLRHCHREWVSPRRQAGWDGSCRKDAAHCVPSLTCVLRPRLRCVPMQRFKRPVARPRRGRGAAVAGGDTRFDRLLTDKRFALGPVASDDEDGDASDTDSTTSGEVTDDDGGEVGVLGRDADDVAFGEETRRLAVMNCDWDHMGAVDILFVLQVCVSDVATVVHPRAVAVGRAPHRRPRRAIVCACSRSCRRQDPSPK